MSAFTAFVATKKPSSHPRHWLRGSLGRDRPKPAERRWRSRSSRSQVQLELAAEAPNPALGRKVWDRCCVINPRKRPGKQQQTPPPQAALAGGGRRGFALPSRRAGALDGSREPVPALAVPSEKVGGILEGRETASREAGEGDMLPHQQRQREPPAPGTAGRGQESRGPPRKRGRLEGREAAPPPFAGSRYRPGGLGAVVTPVPVTEGAACGCGAGTAPGPARRWAVVGRGRRGAVRGPGKTIALSGTGEEAQPRRALCLRESASRSAWPLPRPRRTRASAQVARGALGGAWGDAAGAARWPQPRDALIAAGGAAAAAGCRCWSAATSVREEARGRGAGGAWGAVVWSRTAPAT